MVAISGILVTGCASMPPPATPSGQLEYTFEKVDAKCIHGRFLNFLVDHQLMIRSVTDSQIVAGKESANTAANILLSTQAGGYPEDRVTVLFIPIGDNVRVIMSEQFVSNAGTGFEHAVPIRQTQMAQDGFSEAGTGATMRCPLMPAN